VPFTVGLTIDPSAGNALSCGVDGLFVPSPTGARARLLDLGSEPTVIPAAADGVPARAQGLFDTVDEAINMLAYPAGVGLSHAFAYLECQTGYDGTYLVEASASGWITGPTAEGNVIFRAGIGSSAGGGAVLMGATPVYTTTADGWNIPAVTVASAIQMVAGDQVWLEVAVESYGAGFAGATLSSGPVYDDIPTSGFSFSATRITL
jgi:hypothetical protein